MFDDNRKLVYRDQLDKSCLGSGIPVTGSDLRAAFNAVLASLSVPPAQKPSIGRNIRWEPGNAPRY